MFHVVKRLDASYSPDVDIDENGNVVFARDIAEGEAISIPAHMFARMHATAAPLTFKWDGKSPDLPK